MWIYSDKWAVNTDLVHHATVIDWKTDTFRRVAGSPTYGDHAVVLWPLQGRAKTLYQGSSAECTRVIRHLAFLLARNWLVVEQKHLIAEALCSTSNSETTEPSSSTTKACSTREDSTTGRKSS